MNALLFSPVLLGTNILIASAIICLALWYYSRPYPGPGLWTLGILLLVPGQYLVLGGSYSSSLLQTLLSHTLQVCGEAILVIGVFRFLGRVAPWWLLPAVCLSAVPWLLWHWLVRPLEPEVVIALYTFVSAFIRALACRALLCLPGDRRLRSVQVFAASTFGLLALSAVWGGILSMLDDTHGTGAVQGFESVSELLSFNIGYPLWILCLFGLTLLSLRRFLLASERSATRFERLMKITSAGVVIVRDGLIVDANPMLDRLLGCERSYYHERPLEHLFETDEDLRNQLLALDGVAHDRVALRGDGSPFAAELTVAALDDGTHVAEIRDVSGRKSLEQELRLSASRDALTGALNRRAFTERALHELAQARRHDRSLCLAILDIDHFKRINDSHGHLVGDEALKTFSSTCERQVRRTDIFARFGGEEFVLLLPDTHCEQAFALLERLRTSWSAQRLPVPSGELQSTVSIGLVRVGGEASLDHWISLADQALYQAKNQGRNRTQVATEADRSV
ncbi:diguanylate cyclase [Pseudomonas sp. MPFS]|uniref:sensor domain-containing diguanylate cyclase n=1 Tax=Pseudomonas sp. MPFS TaxID=2795724 RepID=UPI001F149445|nr:sensor domain-containing diguanylate cyclase [Pseudomonas sp. MPFS]UMZ14981.1 diguanylate cyclase [Pseudomonas sp. MPFS]